MHLNNIEHQLWLDRKKKTKNPILKLYFGFEADRLKKHLNTIHSKLQGILGITENETAVYNMINPKIAFNYPISATPGKVDLDPKPIFFHFGAMNWFPNIESAKIFVQDFVPQILVKCPKAKFKMAGAFFDTFQDKIPIDIEKIGFVENSKEFISTAGILVAPIQSGSGVRIKILEALELGTLVLTTTKGAEGISTLKFPNLFIEDNWQKFIDMAVKLASEPSLRIEINLKIESLLNNSWNDPKLLEILTNEGR